MTGRVIHSGLETVGLGALDFRRGGMVGTWEWMIELNGQMQGWIWME